MFIAIIVYSYTTAQKINNSKPNFLWYFIKKQIYRVSMGQLAPPKFPDLKEFQGINLMPPTRNEL